MKKIISRRIAQSFAAVSLSLIPAYAFASQTLCSLAQTVLGYFNISIEVILGLAIVIFVFGIYRYFFMDRENNKERGMYLLWGIVGFACIICFWGLVNLLTNSFSLDNSAPTNGSFNFGSMFGSNSSSCSSTGTTGTTATTGSGSTGGSIGL